MPRRQMPVGILDKMERLNEEVPARRLVAQQGTDLRPGLRVDLAALRGLSRALPPSAGMAALDHRLLGACHGLTYSRRLSRFPPSHQLTAIGRQHTGAPGIVIQGTFCCARQSRILITEKYASNARQASGATVKASRRPSDLARDSADARLRNGTVRRLYDLRPSYCGIADVGPISPATSLNRAGYSPRSREKSVSAPRSLATDAQARKPPSRRGLPSESYPARTERPRRECRRPPSPRSFPLHHPCRRR